MLQKIIHFTDITIEICGTFIWISGNSYPYRKELKEIGFKWASQKKQWYWFAGGTFRKKSKIRTRTAISSAIFNRRKNCAKYKLFI